MYPHSCLGCLRQDEELPRGDPHPLIFFLLPLSSFFLLMGRLSGAHQTTFHSVNCIVFDLPTQQIHTNHVRRYLWGIICLVSYRNFESCDSIQMGAFSGCKGGGKKECQNAGIIKIWISKQFPEFPNFIHEVREVCSEWNPLISLLLARKRWKVQVLTVSVLFLGECESNTRRKCTIPLPASWSIILGGRTEAVSRSQLSTHL